MTIEKSRTTESGAKVLKVLIALKGHTLIGLSNGELAKALKENPSTINRCLNTLIEAGLAIQLDTGRFAHSVTLLQIAQAYTNEMSRAQSRITELQQRVNAGSY
jgi:DNA-binding IclR family transcriptional regulator